MFKKLVRLICFVILLIVAFASISFISKQKNYGTEPAVPSGNAVTILEHNNLLLNQAAEILWNNPEAFLSIQEPGESYSQFSFDELFTYPTIQSHFSAEEIHLLQEIGSATHLVGVGMYYPMYGRAQGISFHFNCTDQSQRVLCYICSVDSVSDQSAVDQVKELLDYMTYEWVTYQPTNYPNWYAEIRRTSY